MTPPPSTAVERFRAALGERLGLRADLALPSQLPRVLETRIAAGQHDGAEGFLAALNQPDELGAAADAVLVPETYFLRDRPQLEHAIAFLRRLATQATGRRLQVASAGCSSGEEPYSLALLLREGAPALTPDAVRITGLDVRPAALATARRAQYSAWSLRETPAPLRSRWFRETAAGFELAPALRESVRFRICNLAQTAVLPAPEGPYDLVCCRNVLMYFDPATMQRVVQAVAAALRPGGMLLLGHAENLRGISRDFELEQGDGVFVYRLRHDGNARPPAPPARPQSADVSGTAVTPLDATDTTWFDAIQAATARIAELRASHAASEPALPITPAAVPPAGALHALVRDERYRDALTLLGPPTAGEDPDASLWRAMLLVASGDRPEAEAVASRLLALDGLHAGAHFVLALCREHAGDLPASASHARAAAHLDPDFALPHLHLGRLARRAGDAAGARQGFRLAAGLLAREDSARILLFGGGFERAALIALCEAALSELEKRR